MGFLFKFKVSPKKVASDLGQILQMMLAEARTQSKEFDLWFSLNHIYITDAAVDSAFQISEQFRSGSLKEEDYKLALFQEASNLMHLCDRAHKSSCQNFEVFMRELSQMLGIQA